MLKFAAAYGSAALTFVILDVIWLGTMTGLLYRPALAPILADQFRVVPVVFFYILFAGGILLFAIMPGLEAQRWLSAAIRGALLGLVAYGTYDLTNHATLSVWATKITLIDMAWGAFATAVASTAGYFAASWFTMRS
jgi:uncharacterized membrane protein